MLLLIFFGDLGLHIGRFRAFVLRKCCHCCAGMVPESSEGTLCPSSHWDSRMIFLVQWISSFFAVSQKSSWLWIHSSIWLNQRHQTTDDANANTPQAWLTFNSKEKVGSRILHFSSFLHKQGYTGDTYTNQIQPWSRDETPILFVIN